DRVLPRTSLLPPLTARMTDLMHDRVISAIGDLYDVGSELGRGGMAVVYRATDLRLRRDVAVKVLPPDLAFRSDVRARFMREAETAAQLNHPNIVPIYSVDERGGIVFFVMALVEGESVGQRIVRQGKLSIDETRRILRDVADALAYAHSRGVVHRDIKPDNILLDRHAGRPMVTDFGIARAAEADSRLTVTGVAVGTPAYMSPEQATGDRELDGRSDIYSLGVVAYHMLAGEPPFKASNTPAMLMKHLSERPRPMRELRPDMPAELAVTIERSLSKRPADRWPDAGSFRDAVSGAIAAVSGQGYRDERQAIPLDKGHGLDADAAKKAHGASARAPYQNPALPPPYPVPAPGIPRRVQRSLEKQWRKDVKRHRQRKDSLETFAARPVDDRVRAFRRNLVATGATTGFLFAINMVTSPEFPWFIFPSLGMSVGVVKQWGSLWADGVGWHDIFGRQRIGAAGRQPLPENSARQIASPDEQALKLVSHDVLDGSYGAAVRRAASDRTAILGIIEMLSKEDRALIPDIAPTVEALVGRVASLAQMLHRLDADVSPEILARIDARIADVERESEESTDHQRRLSLLERQRATLRDLSRRRETVASQLESASIVLGNLRLDLVKLRSSGVGAAIADVTTATREARALSREIGHVLEAADEVRRL
ncbi:MAG: protein kinase domain-containing protein, partial [Gemmatimonadaceae bacterium]